MSRVDDKKINSVIYDSMCKMIEKDDSKTYYQILEVGVEKWYIQFSDPFNDVMLARVVLYRGIEQVDSFKIVDGSKLELLTGRENWLHILAERIRFTVVAKLGI